jgi:hypothetical protein
MCKGIGVRVEALVSTPVHVQRLQRRLRCGGSEMNYRAGP